MAIHVFHGDKGGVGKSFAAAAFGEYLLGKGRQITIVESDARNADAGRYFDGAAVVKKIDLRQTDGWVEFLTLLHSDTSDDIIVSLPSGIGGVFTANAPRLLAAAGDLKRNITVWWLLSRTVDSVVLLAPVTAAFGTAPGVKIVRTSEPSLRRGREVPAVERWQSSGQVPQVWWHRIGPAGVTRIGSRCDVWRDASKAVFGQR